MSRDHLNMVPKAKRDGMSPDLGHNLKRWKSYYSNLKIHRACELLKWVAYVMQIFRNSLEIVVRAPPKAKWSCTGKHGIVQLCQ